MSPALSHLEKSHAGSLRAARPGPGSAAHSNGACQGLRCLQMGPSLLRTHQKYQSLSRVQLFVPPWTTRLLCPWDSPGKNTGVGCPFPFGDLPDPGVKPAPPPLQADSLPPSHLGNLRNPGGSPSSKTITKMHKDKLLHSSVCWVSWVPGCSLS